eukprot:1196377-Prorocentrum_minimum.AAC.5
MSANSGRHGLRIARAALLTPLRRNKGGRQNRRIRIPLRGHRPAWGCRPGCRHVGSIMEGGTRGSVPVQSHFQCDVGCTTSTRSGSGASKRPVA